MSAYYNERDPFAAAWLRELIADDLIAPGEVDERDIQDVKPDDLRPFRQWHLFAGIGIWSAALRGAGWDDGREVLTVSCPCQPFSSAGRGGGFADERHLWPSAFHIIGELGPSVVLGEQVATPDGRRWLDLVSADMEAASYTGAAFDLCSAGFGAPNIRQRLYFVWMAYTEGSRGRTGLCDREPRSERRPVPTDDSSFSGVANANRLGTPTQAGDAGEMRSLQEAQRQPGHGSALSRRGGSTSGVEHPRCQGPSELARGRSEPTRPSTTSAAFRMADTTGGGLGIVGRPDQPGSSGYLDRGKPTGEQWNEGHPLPTNGFWRDAEWVLCRDDRGPTWRPVAPGSFPLASGNIPNRLAALRGSGNALNKEVAQGFIAEVMAEMAAIQTQVQAA